MAPPSPYKRLRRGRASSPIAHRPLNLQERLPVELIYDVFGYLTPIDLLSLSRVQAQLRVLVLGKNTTTDKLWRDALSTVAGLPPCPQWLSPPRYASLCFEKHCDVCLDVVPDDIHGTLWEFFSRYCDKCIPSMLTSDDPFDGLRHALDVNCHLALPSVVLSTTNDHFYSIFYLRIDAARVRNDLLSAPGNKEQKTILEAYRAETATKKEVARQCRSWKTAYIREEKRILAGIQRRRRHLIMDRMADLGFEDEVAGLGLLHDALSGEARRLVMQPKEFDELEWSKIKRVLTCFLNDRRSLQARIDARDLQRTRLAFFEEAVSSYRDSLHANAVCPHAADLAGYVEVRTIVDLEFDPGSGLSSTAFRRLVPRLAERWRASVEAELLATSPQLPIGQTLTVADPSIPWRTRQRATVPLPPPLTLACAGFKCSSCNHLLSPSTAFFHPCCYPRTNSWELTVNEVQFMDGRLPRIDVDTYDNACLVQFRGQLPWSSSTLISISPTIERIVKASGENPAQCTPQTLDRKNIHLACTLCSQKRAWLVVMGWRRAVQHAEEMHPERSPEWTRVPSVVEQKVAELEYQRRSLIPAEAELQAFWECAACDFPFLHSGPHVGRTAADIMQHAQQRHPSGQPISYLRKSADSEPYYHPEILVVSPPQRHDVEESQRWISAIRAKTLVFTKLPEGL